MPGEIALILIPSLAKFEANPLTTLLIADFVQPYGLLSASSPTSDDTQSMLPPPQCLCSANA